MQASTAICTHLPVNADHVYTGICFPHFLDYQERSICICFSRDVPAILPYFTNQSCFSGFHLPPAALAWSRIGMSAASMCRGTRVSATYRGEGGVHSVLSTINSMVFSLCRDSASYLKRTQSRALPYSFARLFVPRCPTYGPGYHMEQTLNNFAVLSALLLVSASLVAVPFFM